MLAANLPQVSLQKEKQWLCTFATQGPQAHIPAQQGSTDPSTRTAQPGLFKRPVLELAPSSRHADERTLFSFLTKLKSECQL